MDKPKGYETYEFEIWQGGMVVASVSSPDLASACREALHYAFVYGQDGDVQIKGDHAEAILGTARQSPQIKPNYNPAGPD